MRGVTVCFMCWVVSMRISSQSMVYWLYVVAFKSVCSLGSGYTFLLLSK